jgi:hypothetical protein
MFAYRLTSTEPPGYRIKFDGVEIDSVSKRTDMHQRDHWHWGVDAMPLMDHGGQPPSGDAESFPAALVAFKAAFFVWHAGLASGLWEENRDYIAAGAKRWQ